MVVPIWYQPWMIRAVAGLAILGVAFTCGCRVQKKIDLAKIQRLKTDYKRCVDIVDTCVDNVDTLELAIKDQNEQITELGKEHDRKVASLKAQHDAAIRRLNTANNAAIRTAEEEAADLRKRMAGLSAAEACHAAWEEVAR